MEERQTYIQKEIEEDRDRQRYKQRQTGRDSQTEREERAAMLKKLHEKEIGVYHADISFISRREMMPISSVLILFLTATRLNHSCQFKYSGCCVLAVLAVSTESSKRIIVQDYKTNRDNLSWMLDVLQHVAAVGIL